MSRLAQIFEDYQYSKTNSSSKIFFSKAKGILVNWPTVGGKAGM